jgi:hypothetical protein
MNQSMNQFNNEPCTDVLFSNLKVIQSLTLILPGEVKVDLSDLDIKLRKTLYELYFSIKCIFLQKLLANPFEFHTGCQKIMFGHFNEFLLLRKQGQN